MAVFILVIFATFHLVTFILLESLSLLYQIFSKLQDATKK